MVTNRSFDPWRTQDLTQSQQNSQYPVKAKLIPQDSGVDTIEFLFNPTELDFSRSLQLNPEPASRTAKGLPKVSFGYINPYTLTISNILFDTYESGASVLEQHINKLRQAVEFVGSINRPPIYIFTWGSQQYLRCFVKSLSYKLTLFLPDGTPVRAVANLTLEEVDESVSTPGMGTPSPTPNRPEDNRQNRSTQSSQRPRT